MSATSRVEYDELRTGILQLRTLERSYCGKLVARLSDYQWMSSTIAEVRGFSVIEYAREDIRSSLSIGEPSARNLMDETLRIVEPATLGAFSDYWGMNDVLIKSPQFTKYNPGHFIKTHTDDGAAFPNRIGSVVTYLTDDYEGGQISFPKFGIEFKPVSGTTLLFPSEYVHEVLPIVQGTKYIFLFFIEVSPSVGC